ncbi:hypothetical protein J8L98_16450 [Pseudoalteromonas sp. MMG013]|uniref:hypothetical protein n=1 Tax=Pseudoalteromonas sp. MMG013 TaxID=2822687 RepID=UPI001B370589|nr:hypothetical protein [Pseudoalteromonas sp. MMG013]MBQ4863276.1 hypothetical protein [Pseudoalteromonas sp. MMG013]
MKIKSLIFARALLLFCAFTATVTAVAHMSCIVLGEQCYRAQLAPSIIIDSAIQGTYFAPLATLFISSLFLLCALYALSAAKLIPHIPLTRFAIFTIGSLCIVRGGATLPLLLLQPALASIFAVIAGMLWFLCGLFYIWGYRLIISEGKS